MEKEYNFEIKDDGLGNLCLMVYNILDKDAKFHILSIYDGLRIANEIAVKEDIKNKKIQCSLFALFKEHAVK